MNWSQFKKTWVTAQVCLLTFSVYFGSAIYTAGITDVAFRFHVSQVASTLGLTFFLLGAGTGQSL
jgi:DHA1 family multidrug resistance protein-like MFS transporter